MNQPVQFSSRPAMPLARTRRGKAAGASRSNEPCPHRLVALAHASARRWAGASVVAATLLASAQGALAQPTCDANVLSPVITGMSLFFFQPTVCNTQSVPWTIADGGSVTFGTLFTPPVLFINGSNNPSGVPTTATSIENLGLMHNTAYATFVNAVALNNYNTFRNDGTFIVTAFQGLVDNRGSFSNSGTLQFDAANDLRVSFSNSGLLTSSGTVRNNWVLLNASPLASFDMTGSASLFVNAWTVDNFGTFAISGGRFESTGRVYNQASGVLTNDSQFVSDGFLSINDGLWRNRGVMTMADGLQNNGVFANEGIGATLQLNGGFVIVGAGGTMSNSAAVTLDEGSILVRNGGTFSNTGTVSGTGAWSTDGLISLTGGSFAHEGSFDVLPNGVLHSTSVFRSHGVLQNLGSVVLAGTQTFQAGAQFSNFANATFDGRTGVERGATIDNRGDLRIVARASLVNDGGLINQAMGTVTVSGDLRNTNSINNAGHVTVAAGGTLSNEALIDNNGVVTVAGGGDFINTGYVGNSGSFTLVSTFGSVRNVRLGTFYNAPGAVLALDGPGGNLLVGSTLTNAGLLTVSADGRASLQTDTKVTNTGRIESLGYLVVYGEIQNQGTMAANVVSVLNTPSGSGNIVNTGNLSASALSLDSRENMINYGSLAVSSMSVGANSSYSFWNEGVATIQNFDSSGAVRNFQSWTTSGTFINNGYFLNDFGATAVLGVLTNLGRLQNAGHLRIVTVAGLAASSSLESFNGSLTAAQIQNAGTLQVSNGPFSVTQLDNAGSAVIGRDTQLSMQRLNNSGTMTFYLNTADSHIDSAVNRGSVTVSGPMTLVDWANEGPGRLDATVNMRINGNFNNAGFVRFGGAVSGSGRYAQTGGYTEVNGDFTLSELSLSGGSLCGTGRITSHVTVSGGTLCPGHSPGTLTVDGDLAFTGGTIELQIAGSAAGLYDQLVLNGSASFLAGVLRINFIDGYVLHAGDSWLLLVLGGPVTGLGNLSAEVNGLPDGVGFVLNVNSGGLSVAVSAVPEPATWAVWLGGLLVLGASARMRRGPVTPTRSSPVACC